MRSPFDTDAQETKVAPGLPVGRDPSYPDRARLDSDVRAFLRPASSPWIVFDRDSRIDDFAKSALRVGAVFASRPTMHDRVASAAMFPTEEIPAAPVVEPSTVVVASDVLQPAPTTRPRSSFTIPDGLVRKGGGRIGIAAAAIGVVVGVTALLAVRPAKHVAPAPAAAPPTVVVAAPVVTAAPVVAAAEPAPAVEVTKPAADADPKTKRLGKLTIKADPKTKNVWFDGKRMLGSGSRSFLVACGMHTIAVNEKTEARDVEVPCNGEYAIGGGK